VDLDHFKEYNDCYGFPRGDEMILLVATLLKEFLDQVAVNGRLGHIGGDDFVIIARSLADPIVLERLCAEFDTGRMRLFPPEDAARGSYTSVDRQGNPVEVPLVTLSVAVVTDRNMPVGAHPAQVGQVAAAIKRKVKTMNTETRQSNYLIDQRVQTSGPAAGRPA
jgi:GGDEF domain-containing protein